MSTKRPARLLGNESMLTRAGAKISEVLAFDLAPMALPYS